MEKLTVQDLAMYIGCEVLAEHGLGKLRGVDSNGYAMITYKKNFSPDEDYETNDKECKVSLIKLILRPFSDITEEEKVGMLSAKYSKLKVKSVKFFDEFSYTAKVDYFSDHQSDWIPSVVIGYLGPKEIKYLISKGFDLFDLIPKGLALTNR